MEILKKVLGQMSLENFLEKHLYQLPISVAGGAEAYCHYLNWKVIKEIFESKKSMLRIVKEGKMVKDDAPLDFQASEIYFKNGHTLVIKNSEKSHPLLAQMAEAFSSFFYAPVDIQLFCTPAKTFGFGWHYDVEDVFIFQTMGTKNFTLRQNTVHHHPTHVSSPKDQGFDKETSNLFIDVKLKAGDWLYIPAGWWHKAESPDEDSMHISLGVFSKSAVDVLPVVARELASNPFWRTRFPLYHHFATPDEEVAFYQEGLKEMGKDIADKLSKPEFIKSLIAQLRQN